MPARKAVANFFDHAAEGGTPMWYRLGDKVPADVVKRLGDSEALFDRDGGDDEPDEQPDDKGSSKSEIPAKAGAGSSRDAWAAYAKANDVEVPEDAKRDDIIALLDAAEVPTE